MISLSQIKNFSYKQRQFQANNYTADKAKGSLGWLRRLLLPLVPATQGVFPCCMRVVQAMPPAPSQIRLFLSLGNAALMTAY